MSVCRLVCADFNIAILQMLRIQHSDGDRPTIRYASEYSCLTAIQCDYKLKDLRNWF